MRIKLTKNISHLKTGTEYDVVGKHKVSVFVQGVVVLDNDGQKVIVPTGSYERIFADTSSVTGEYLKKIELYRDLVEDLPYQAQDFAESVDKKLKSFAKWIEERGYLTDAQVIALDNMCDGVDRWLHRDED